MDRIALILVFGLLSATAGAQTNVTLLHQLVEANKKEHALQLETRTSQAGTTAQEEVNRGMLQKVKQNYHILQERFNKVNILIDAVGMGRTALPIIKSIMENQQKIIEHCQNNPAWVPMALQTEERLVHRARGLLNYLVGLSTAIGELNQMKISDRRLLFQHVIDELGDIHQLSKGMVSSLKSNRQFRKDTNPFTQASDDDLQAMEEVISNLKTQSN